MIIPDLNILIYAYNASAKEHAKAKAWWEQQIGSGELIGIPWVVLLGFLRILSGTKVVEEPYRTEELFSIIDSWLSYTNVQPLEQTLESYQVLKELMIELNLSGASTTDASIAALAFANKAKVATNDTDFFRYKELELLNPI